MRPVGRRRSSRVTFLGGREGEGGGRGERGGFLFVFFFMETHQPKGRKPLSTTKRGREGEEGKNIREVRSLVRHWCSRRSATRGRVQDDRDDGLLDGRTRAVLRPSWKCFCIISTERGCAEISNRVTWGKKEERIGVMVKEGERIDNQRF